MDMQRALEVAAATSELEMRRAYRQAVAQGATNTGCTANRDRDYDALRLLTLATLRMPDLVLYAGLADVYEDGPDANRFPRPGVLATKKRSSTTVECRTFCCSRGTSGLWAASSSTIGRVAA